MNISMISNSMPTMTSIGPTHASATGHTTIVIPKSDEDQKELSPLAALLILSALNMGHRIGFKTEINSLLAQAVSGVGQADLFNQTLNSLMQPSNKAMSNADPALSPMQGVANTTGVAAYAQVSSASAGAVGAVGSAVSVSA